MFFWDCYKVLSHEVELSQFTLGPGLLLFVLWAPHGPTGKLCADMVPVMVQVSFFDPIFWLFGVCGHASYAIKDPGLKPFSEATTASADSAGLKHVEVEHHRINAPILMSIL